MKLLHIMLMLLISSPAWAATLTVGSGKHYDPADFGGDVSRAIEAATNEADNGDIVEIQDGINGADIDLINISKNMGSATFIQPETLGGVVFSGRSRIRIDGDHWVLRGFVFTNFEHPGKYGSMVVVSSKNNRITECKFLNTTTPKKRPLAIYVKVSGDNVEIDHNTCDNWWGGCVVADTTLTDVTLSPHIHHNYFGNIPKEAAVVDDRSPLMLSGRYQDATKHQDMDALVEYNVFENCVSDPETIMDKCSSNVHQYNVFYNSNGISLRNGEESKVVHNYFFYDNGQKVSYAIAITDKGHEIVGNYIQGIPAGTGRVISLGHGNRRNRSRAEDILIEANTIADSGAKMAISFVNERGGLPPVDIAIRSNIIHSLNGHLIVRDFTRGEARATWANNFSYTRGAHFRGTGPGGGWPTDGRDLDQLTIEEFADLWTTRKTDYGDMYILDSQNVAIDAGYYNSNYPADMDGEARGPGRTDAGSDEFGPHSSTHGPISKSCVGTTWDKKCETDPDQAPEPALPGGDYSAGDTTAKLSGNATINREAALDGLTNGLDLPGGDSGSDWAEFTISSGDIFAAEGRFAVRVRINRWDDITYLMRADDGSHQNLVGLYLDKNNEIFANYRMAGGRYNGLGSSSYALSAGTTHIIEYQRDLSGHHRRIFVDGEEVAGSDMTMTAIDLTRLRIGNIADSGKGDVHIDTVVISSDPNDDLYTMITTQGPGYPGSTEAPDVTFWWSAESKTIHTADDDDLRP